MASDKRQDGVEQAAELEDGAAPDDISQSVNGNRAVTGKAVWSANSAAHFARDNEDHDRQEQHNEEAREAQELAHLAEWNAEMTTLGGVAMTNEEAQKA